MRQRDGVLTLRLSPESLGDIKIQVRVESGQVSARIDAQTDQARQLLIESTATLRTALEAHGLVVERIEVAPAERNATMDPAVAMATPADQRAQGGALSPTDQPPPQGFGDGAPPEHRDAHGQHADGGSSGPDEGVHASSDAENVVANAIITPDALDLTQVEGHWVLRVDLVA